VLLQGKAGAKEPFVLELPQYRLPAAKSLVREIWQRTWHFLQKAGTVILLCSLAVWLLAHLGWQNGRLVMAQSLADGLLARLGQALAFLFAPLGFGQWQAVAATLTAFIAKENAVSTLGILYPDGIAAQLSPLSGLCFLLFNLLSAPCVAAVSALRRERGRRGMWFALAWQCGLAYVVAGLVWWVGGRC
jgi:ferrous iron transport protein B